MLHISFIFHLNNTTFMVIISDKSSAPTTIYPMRTTTSTVNELTLRLHSISSNTDYTFPVDDTGALRDYYEIEVDFSAIPDGEYEYSIGQDCGLMWIGEYNEKRQRQNKQYINGETTQYKQYDG